MLSDRWTGHARSELSPAKTPPVPLLDASSSGQHRRHHDLPSLIRHKLSLPVVLPFPASNNSPHLALADHFLLGGREVWFVFIFYQELVSVKLVLGECDSSDIAVLSQSLTCHTNSKQSATLSLPPSLPSCPGFSIVIFQS